MWFKVDDGFAHHPKLEVLEGDPIRYGMAVAVWVLMGSDCARGLTDGLVSRSRIKKVCWGLGKHAFAGAEALVEAGLWSRSGDDYCFHDWAQYQPMRADVESKRAIDAQRQRLGRGQAQRIEVIRKWGYACAYCESALTEKTLQIDHVLPIALGGSNHIANLVPACGPCNASKQGLTIEEWLATKRPRVSELNHEVVRKVSARTTFVRPDIVASVSEPPVPTRPDPEEREQIMSGGRSWDSPAHAYTREALPTWTADKQALCFQKAYLARRQTSPSMGGRQVGDFHKRVLQTAEARGMPPEKLFVEVLDRWLSRELNEREKSSPYACFANAFGELVDREGRGMSAEIKLMQEQAAEALRVVRGGR